MNPVVRSDIVVAAFLDSVGGYRHKERRNRLLDILDVDLDWSVALFLGTEASIETIGLSGICIRSRTGNDAECSCAWDSCLPGTCFY